MLETSKTKATRVDVVNSLLSLFSEPSYLEVGVATGATFLAALAKRKVGVDPKFLFDTSVMIEGAEFHAKSSDDYFGSVAKKTDRFDVIFLDGLHTAEQTLRDLLNAREYLAADGVIIIDDAIPSSYPASLANRQDFFKMKEALSIKKGAWMGDVFRLIFFIETFMQSFSYRITSDNHGQIVLWRARRAAVKSRTIAEVGAKEYVHLFSEHESLRFAKLADIVLEVKNSRRS
jgi:hypothetical protein